MAVDIWIGPCEHSQVCVETVTKDRKHYERSPAGVLMFLDGGSNEWNTQMTCLKCGQVLESTLRDGVITVPQGGKA